MTMSDGPAGGLTNGQGSGKTSILMKESSKPKLKKREQWAKKIDFLLACIGVCVGLGNVWRFPFLCYRNGGGAFLIPYFIATFIGGIPMFFLEVALGQYMSEGGIGPWKIAPLFKGIGYAATVIVFLVICEYIIVLTWIIYYVFASFATTLPWSHCDNSWNTQNCTVSDGLQHLRQDAFANMSATASYGNHSKDRMIGYLANGRDLMISNLTGQVAMATDPVTEFWERKVLGLSPGIDQPGNIKWDLALCLLLAWVVVYLCICKGIKSSGKVMYVTATSPYIFMIILLVRGVTLEGASIGLDYYLNPNWERLADAQVWVDAGTQIFFSYAISMGSLTALGSYNKFHHNCFRDSLVFALVNTFTSILAGFVIFSVLGFMAFRQNVSVEDVAESGPGLAFIVYPEAVAQLPVAPLWSALFFIMLILLGLDSQFIGVEAFITACVDLYPNILRRGYRKEVFTGVVCIICYIIGLSMVTEGGMYVFLLFDYYTASRIIMLLAVVECVVVAYVYGINRFTDNLVIMFGFTNKPLVLLFRWTLKLCWCYLSPLFTLAVFILGCVSYSELSYKRKFAVYEYPPWAIGVGWLLALISVALIPIFMVQGMLTAQGTFMERMKLLTTPHLKKHQLRPNEDLSKVVLCDDQDNFNQLKHETKKQKKTSDHYSMSMSLLDTNHTDKTLIDV